MAVLKKGALQCALVEALGTFLLALTAFQTGDPLTIGLVLMAAMYIGTHTHIPAYNSAVSFAEWFSGKIDLNSFFVALGGQVVGAIAAAKLSYALNAGSAPMLPASGMAGHMLGLTEAITTFVFVSVVMIAVCQTDRFKNSDIYGLIVGLSATGLIRLAGGLAIFNPAIALGVMVHNRMVGASTGEAMPTGHVVPYVIVPFVAAMLAVWFHDYIRGSKK